MHNPYQAPNAAPDNREAAEPPSKVWLVLGLTSSTLAAVIVTVLVGPFRDVLIGFGAELPWLTRVFLSGFWTLWLLPVAISIAWFYWPRVHQRIQIAVAAGLTSLLVVVPVFLYAMYSPIFKLAAVV